MDENGCTAVAPAIVVISSTDDFINNLEFLLLPNPNDGIFQIKIESQFTSSLSISIFNILGEQVLVMNPGANESLLSLKANHLDNGQYMIHITDGIHHGVSKFLVIK